MAEAASVGRRGEVAAEAASGAARRRQRQRTREASAAARQAAGQGGAGERRRPLLFLTSPGCLHSAVAAMPSSAPASVHACRVQTERD
uniref:Uncharacterized protein n=1 Tax=Oryza sativa subsp. japonica TaxID=39947 RepID=Q69NA9_ORYSJ|nr:hypothetical protein [Oryza sativa Japonica Group]